MLIYRFQDKDIFSYVNNLDMASWPYDNNSKGYGKLELMVQLIKQKKYFALMDLLDENNISTLLEFILIHKQCSMMK